MIEVTELVADEVGAIDCTFGSFYGVAIGGSEDPSLRWSGVVMEHLVSYARAGGAVLFLHGAFPLGAAGSFFQQQMGTGASLPESVEEFTAARIGEGFDAWDPLLFFPYPLSAVDDFPVSPTHSTVAAVDREPAHWGRVGRAVVHGRGGRGCYAMIRGRLAVVEMGHGGPRDYTDAEAHLLTNILVNLGRRVWGEP